VTRRFQGRFAFGSLSALTAAGLLAAFALANYSAAGGATASTTSTTQTSSTTQEAPSTTATTIKLTVKPADASRTIDFGLARSVKPATFHFTADPPMPDTRTFAYIPVDLIDDSGKSIDQSNVTSSAGLVPGSGGKTITVKLSVDPKDAKPGRYKGDVEIQGTDVVTAKNGTLTAILAPHRTRDYLIAFVVILVGTGIGTVVKYASESGSKRGRLRRRLQTIDDTVNRLGRDNFANAFLEKLRLAKQELESGQTSDAETTINDLWGKLEGLEDAAVSSKRIRAMFAQQAHVIDKEMHAEDEVKEKLAHAISEEATVLGHDIDNAFSSPDTGKQERQDHALWFDGYSTFLRAQAGTPAEDWKKSPLNEIVALYADGKFDDAEAKRKQPPAAAPERVAALSEGNETIDIIGQRAILSERGPVTGSWWKRRLRGRRRRRQRQLGPPESIGQRIRDWFDDRADFFLWVFTPVAVALAGVLYVYATDTSFDSSDLANWGKLLAWGFVGQLSGTTIVQAFGIGKTQAGATA
jgi:hypothetical protein